MTKGSVSLVRVATAWHLLEVCSSRVHLVVDLDPLLLVGSCSFRGAVVLVRVEVAKWRVLMVPIIVVNLWRSLHWWQAVSSLVEYADVWLRRWVAVDVVHLPLW
jgi:hypothetical protein